MKACFKCNEIKPLSEFYKHSMMADGHLNKCKKCTKKDVGKHRLENLERIQAYDRERGHLPHRKEMRERIAREWTKNNPLKKAASTAVNNAIRDGKLIPWPVCAMPECNKKPEAHHPDYDRPLDVVWLCRSHHRLAHHDYKREE